MSIEGAAISALQQTQAASLSAGDSLHRSARRLTHIPELDGIRGLAIFMVLVYHGFALVYPARLLGPVGRVALAASITGQFGVHLFFVLSGFLITRILLHSRTGESGLRGFYVRRALRILPAFYLCLAALLIAGTDRRFIVASLLVGANISTLFGIPLGFAPLWSLAVEEHFYLAWPWMVRRWTEKTLLRGLAFVILASPAVRMLYFRFFPNAGEYRFFSWCAFDGLALGCLAALLYVRNEAAASRLGAALGAAGLAGTCLLALRHSLGRASLLGAGFQASVVYLCCAGLLLGAVSGQVGILKFLFRNRALAFLGQISYGLYLYHVIFLEKLTYTRPLPAAWPGFAAEANDMVFRVIWPLGAAVAAAFLSRISIEEYFLRRKSRLAPRP